MAKIKQLSCTQMVDCYYIIGGKKQRTGKCTPCGAPAKYITPGDAFKPRPVCALHAKAVNRWHVRYRKGLKCVPINDMKKVG